MHMHMVKGWLSMLSLLTLSSRSLPIQHALIILLYKLYKDILHMTNLCKKRLFSVSPSKGCTVVHSLQQHFSQIQHDAM